MLGNRAQGSTEVLLIISAAVIVAIIVGLALKQIIAAPAGKVASQTTQTVEQIGNQ